MQNNKQEYQTNIPGYFTLGELSNICGYTKTEYLRRLCTEKRILAYKTGTLWLIPYEQGIDFIRNKNNL